MKEADKLTDKETWQFYWDNKGLNSLFVEQNLLFHKLFERLFETNRINSFIEIGGYPGTYSAYVKKYFRPKFVAFIDFVNDRKIYKKLLKANNLEESDISIIEQDLFNNNISVKFDLVFSNGFIEHFNDTGEILLKHRELLSSEGYVLIALPNFRGINGWIQKKYDPKNYLIHNINCMDIEFLRNELTRVELTNSEVFYYGNFSIWLENLGEKNKLFQLGFKIVWFIGKVLSKMLRFQSKIFSPYICIIAQNK